MKNLHLLLFLLIVVSSSARLYTLDSSLNLREYGSDQFEDVIVDNLTIAKSNFTNHLTDLGWLIYNVTTFSPYPDWLQAYAIGYLEGYAAADSIWNVWNNAQQRYQTNCTPEVWEWVNNQMTWIKSNLEQNPKDDYWGLVNITMNMLIGLFDGFMLSNVMSNNIEHSLNFQQFYTVTYMSDLFDVMAKFSQGNVNLSPQRSTSLLRIGKDDMYFGHNTGFDYIGLLKIYKFMTFDFTNSLVTIKSMAFSSQPGSVASQDDYYVMDNNVSISSTHLPTFNTEVYSYLNYKSLPYWIRVIIANLGYDNQQKWAETYFKYHSGTNNNQWIVVDYKKYLKDRKDVKKLVNSTDIVWIVEEFYSLTSVIDVSQDLLMNGYIASYNTPFNQSIAKLSKNPESYTNSSKYVLFLKYSPEIQTLNVMEEVMRLNNISDTNNYAEAISSRADLNKTTFFPNGALDSKILEGKKIKTMEVNMICGPTNYVKLPNFTWNSWPQFVNFSQGMVTEFNFDWFSIKGKKDDDGDGYSYQDIFI